MTTFREYRQQVSIIQVAESLGYVVDFRKGRKSLEYKNLDGDAIIINNPADAARQLYYNRDGSRDKGSVIDFVSNRLNKFNVNYQTQIEGVNKVLSRFACEPQACKPAIIPPAPVPFSAARYALQPASLFKLHYLVKERGLTPETVQKFLPFIRLVKDTTKELSKAYTNIAFPLTRPGSQELAGYDLRNYGFKGVAAGSDRQQGMWIADFVQEPARTRNVFFGENPIDIMSFYQLKKNVMDLDNAAFISFGGGIARNQLALALQHWPHAARHTLFDNDYQGKVYDIVLAAAISGKEVSFKKEADSLLFSVGEKKFEITVPKLSLSAFEQQSGIRSGLHVHKAKGYKDFNDVIHPEKEVKKPLERKRRQL